MLSLNKWNRHIFVFLVILTSYQLFAQKVKKEYNFSLVKLECLTDNNKLIDYYKFGFEALNYPRLANTAGKIFFNIIQEDKSLCDAYFYTGISLTKQDKHQAALNYYYYADSLATNSNADFKQALAEAAVRVGNVGLARKKYEELIIDFPNDPDAYYGMGLTATSIGDVQNGLNNLLIAEEKYLLEGTWDTIRKIEVFLMRGILFTMDKQYQEAINAFDHCSEVFNDLDDFNANYALASYKLYQESQDEKWKEVSKTAFERIKAKDKLRKSYLEMFDYTD